MAILDFFRSRPKTREEWIKYAYKNLASLKEAKERLRRIPLEKQAYERKRIAQKKQADFYTGKIEALAREEKKRHLQMTMAYRHLASTPAWAKKEAESQLRRAV